MSNLAVGGRDRQGRQFAFYETLPGGAGAGPQRAGRAAVQTHMTNTRNTPVEEFEHRYPMRVEALTVRRGSGGRGKSGGAGGGRVMNPQAMAARGKRRRGEVVTAGAPFSVGDRLLAGGWSESLIEA